MGTRILEATTAYDWTSHIFVYQPAALASRQRWWRVRVRRRQEQGNGDNDSSLEGDFLFGLADN